MENRILHWEGCVNVRDLGGLRTGDGRTTRWQQLIRSDTPARLTETGWAALHAYGVRTVVTLYTVGMVEPELDYTPPYADITRVRVAIEDVTDRDFVERYATTDLWGTPLYYADALQRWPARHAAALSAIARAQHGGVLFHCIRGHDRTGIITLLLLGLAGVTVEEQLADYALSVDPVREEVLAREGSSVREAVLAAFGGLDVAGYLLAGGATEADLAALRARLSG